MTAFIHGRGTAPLDATIATEHVIGQSATGVEEVWSIVDPTNTTRTKLFRMSDAGVFIAAAGMTIAAFSTAGVLHNNASGQFSSSLIVNADVATGAAIGVAKLELGATNTVLHSNGSLNAFTGAPIVSTSLRVVALGVTSTVIQAYTGGSAAAIYMGNVTPSAANPIIFSDGSTSGINSGGTTTGALNFTITGLRIVSVAGPSSVAFPTGAGLVFNRDQAYKISQQAPLTDLPTYDLTIQSMEPFSGASANITPGNIVLNVSDPVSTGLAGFTKFAFGGVVRGLIGRTGTNTGLLWLGDAAAAPVLPGGAGVGNYTLSVTQTAATPIATLNGPAGGFVSFAIANNSQWNVSSTSLGATSIKAAFLEHNQRTGDNPTFDFTISSQAPSATASPGVNRNSGNLLYNIATPGSGGAAGLHRFQSRGVNQVQMGEYVGFPTFGTIWLGNAVADITNWTISGDGLTHLAFGIKSASVGGFSFVVDTANGSPAGSGFQIAGFGASGGVNQLTFGTNLTAAAVPSKIYPLSRTTDTAVADITLEGMAPWVSAGVGQQDSGNVIVNIPAPAGVGAYGKSKFSFGGTVHAQFWPHPQFPTLVSGLWLGPGVVPGNTNFSLATNISGQSTLVNAPSGQVLLTIANVTAFSVQSLSKYGIFSNVATWSTGTIDPTASELDGSLYTKTGSPNGDLFLRRNGAWISLLNGSGFVTSARQIIAGAGMTGGGDLSADRTLNVIAHADGSIVVHADDVQVGVLATDAQHGNRGGGLLHSVVTNLASGFAPALNAANRILLTTNGTSVLWGTIDLTTMANAGAANTVPWSNGSVISWTGSPVLSTSLSIGTNPAATGALRVANNAGLFGRNTANSIDITLVSIDTNNHILVGTSATAVRIPILSTGVVHADGTGILSSSLIVNADITTATITASKLNGGGTANRVLITTDGVNTSWGQVNLGSVMITGALPTANLAGGTNGQVLQTVTTVPVWTTYAGNVTGSASASAVVGLTGIGSPGVVTHAGTTITTANNELVFEQTGDALGTSRIRVRNRAAASGLVVENATADVIDLRMTGGTIVANIRLEGRGGQMRTGATEFQIGTAGNPTLSVGTANNLLWLSNTTVPSATPSGGGFIYENSGGVYHKGANQLTTTMGATGSSPLTTPTFKDTRIGSVITNAAGTSSANIITIDFANDYPGMSSGRWTWVIRYTVTKMDTSTHVTYTYCRIVTGSLQSGGLPTQDGGASDLFNANGCTSTPSTETIQASPFGGPLSSLWAIAVADVSANCKWFAEAQIFIAQI